MNNMKAAIMHKYGGPDVLSIEEVQVPEPKENEILIKVICSIVTRADTMMMTGKPYIGRLFLGLRKPKNPVPGTGYSGVVERVGKRVEQFTVGDEVFGETATSLGANAEFLVVPERSVILNKPKNISFEEAATYSDGLATSYNFLNEVITVQPGQKVLINGASGSLGTAAIQLASYLGAEVTGVCSTKNVELVKSLGADFVVDYKKVDFTKADKQYDVIFDTIGGRPFGACKRVLVNKGVYLSPVLSFRLMLQSMWTSIFKGKKAKFAATGLKKDSELLEIFKSLIAINNTAGLRAVIDKRFQLDDIEMAYHYVITGRKTGNVLLIIE